MLPRQQPDRIHVAFDDHRLVANAGLLLPVTLADRGMQKRGSKYEPPPLPLESDFCPQRRNGLCGEQLAAVPYLNEPVVLPGFTLTSGDPK